MIKKRAFTLIELIMAITIISILAVIAGPRYISLRHDALVANERHSLLKLQETLRADYYKNDFTWYGMQSGSHDDDENPIKASGLMDLENLGWTTGSRVNWSESGEDVYGRIIYCPHCGANKGISDGDGGAVFIYAYSGSASSATWGFTMTEGHLYIYRDDHDGTNEILYYAPISEWTP